MQNNKLESRSWQGTPIQRRTTAGYVNATAMCRANGKQWSKYRESDRCQTYLDALAKTSEIRMFDLIESRQGQGGGTWVHPQVAVDLARWISAPFAVWMDGWFLEEVRLRGSGESAPQPTLALGPRETLDLIERSYSMLERLGVADDRDRLQFGDMVRNTAARAAGGLLLAPADPELEEVTLSEAWLEVTGKPLPRGKGSAIGKLIAEMYREEFGEEPPTRRQFVDGAPRSVKSYVRRYLHKTIRAVSSRFLPAASEAAD